LIPIITLIILLASAIYLYGVDDTSGPIQVALMMSMMVAGLIGLKNGHTKREEAAGQSRLLWNRWSKGRAYRARSGCHEMKAIVQLLVQNGIIGPIRDKNDKEGIYH
jgi:hypothetical protein